MLVAKLYKNTIQIKFFNPYQINNAKHRCLKQLVKFIIHCFIYGRLNN